MRCNARVAFTFVTPLAVIGLRSSLNRRVVSFGTMRASASQVQAFGLRLPKDSDRKEPLRSAWASRRGRLRRPWPRAGVQRTSLSIIYENQSRKNHECFALRYKWSVAFRDGFTGQLVEATVSAGPAGRCWRPGLGPRALRNKDCELPT